MALLRDFYAPSKGVGRFKPGARVRVPPSPPESQKSRIYGDFWLFLLPVLSNTKDDKILWNTVKYSPTTDSVTYKKLNKKQARKNSLACFLKLCLLWDTCKYA